MGLHRQSPDANAEANSNSTCLALVEVPHDGQLHVGTSHEAGIDVDGFAGNSGTVVKIKKKRSLGAAMRRGVENGGVAGMLQPSLLRSLSRPSTRAGLPGWAARVRDRLCAVEAQLRRLDREKQFLLGQLIGAPQDVLDAVFPDQLLEPVAAPPLAGSEQDLEPLEPLQDVSPAQGGSGKAWVQEGGATSSSEQADSLAPLPSRVPPIWAAAAGSSDIFCDGSKLHPRLAEVGGRCERFAEGVRNAYSNSCGGNKTDDACIGNRHCRSPATSPGTAQDIPTHAYFASSSTSPPNFCERSGSLTAAVPPPVAAPRARASVSPKAKADTVPEDGPTQPHAPVASVPESSFANLSAVPSPVRRRSSRALASSETLAPDPCSCNDVDASAIEHSSCQPGPRREANDNENPAPQPQWLTAAGSQLSMHLSALTPPSQECTGVQRTKAVVHGHGIPCSRPTSISEENVGGDVLARGGTNRIATRVTHSIAPDGFGTGAIPNLVAACSTCRLSSPGRRQGALQSRCRSPSVANSVASTLLQSSGDEGADDLQSAQAGRSPPGEHPEVVVGQEDGAEAFAWGINSNIGAQTFSVPQAMSNASATLVDQCILVEDSACDGDIAHAGSRPSTPSINVPMSPPKAARPSPPPSVVRRRSSMGLLDRLRRRRSKLIEVLADRQSLASCSTRSPACGDTTHLAQAPPSVSSSLAVLLKAPPKPEAPQIADANTAPTLGLATPEQTRQRIGTSKTDVARLSTTLEGGKAQASRGGKLGASSPQVTRLHPEVLGEDGLKSWMAFFGLKPSKSRDFMVRRLQEIDAYLHSAAAATPGAASAVVPDGADWALQQRASLLDGHSAGTGERGDVTSSTAPLCERRPGSGRSNPGAGDNSARKAQPLPRASQDAGRRGKGHGRGRARGGRACGGHAGGRNPWHLDDRDGSPSVRTPTGSSTFAAAPSSIVAASQEVAASCMGSFAGRSPVASHLTCRQQRAAEKALALEQSFAEVIRRDTDLYERFLCFEVIDINEVRDRITTLRPELRSVGEGRLRNFLDSQGLLFSSGTSTQDGGEKTRKRKRW